VMCLVLLSVFADRTIMTNHSYSTNPPCTPEILYCHRQHTWRTRLPTCVAGSRCVVFCWR